MRDTRTKRGKTKIEGGFSRLDLTDWTEPLTWADPRAIYLDMCIDRVHHLLHLYVFKKGKKSSRNNRFFFWFLLSWNQKMQRGHEGICCSPPLNIYWGSADPCSISLRCWVRLAGPAYILGGGARARNPPSSAVVVYQVISGKGSEGFYQAEVWNVIGDLSVGS